MNTCNAKATPSAPGAHLTKPMFPTTEDEADDMKRTPYREAAGSLMHLATMTRPDICHAVGQVSKFCENPGPAHWNGVTRILPYLSGTDNFGIRYGPPSPSVLPGYYDAAFAEDPDTRKSTSGYVFLLYGGPVSWASRQQSGTALLNTEAEFVAMAEASKEAVWVWLLRLLDEMQLRKPGPITLFCDKMSALKLVKNGEYNQKTKHIETKFYHLRDQQERSRIDTKYISTDDQLADSFTKPLPAPRFENLRTKIGVVPVENLLDLKLALS